MMRALFAGVSGLRNHQTRMDVIGNNIANVNTVGFKSSRVTFKEAFAQLIRGAAQPTAQVGGTNSIRIGSGSNIGSVDQLFTQGSFEFTGINTDMAIQGDSLFVTSNGGQTFFTRAGAFQIDANGSLVTSNGSIVQGRTADSTGAFPPGAQIGNIQLQLGSIAGAQPTSQVTIAGNLDAAAIVGDTHAMSVTVFDSSGTPHDLSITYTNTGSAAWDWTATSPTATVTAGNGTVSFNPDGTLAAFTYPGGGTDITITPTGSGGPLTVAFNAGTVGAIDGLAGFANVSDATVNGQDGFASGTLVDFSVDSKGVLTAFFTNGTTRDLAQIALAKFNNPAGLIRAADNAYQESPNSGIPIVGFSGTNNSSTITPGALESSNVDISQEFTSMIIAQRGFQANARVITTADEMLTELVNIKR